MFKRRSKWAEKRNARCANCAYFARYEAEHESERIQLEDGIAPAGECRDGAASTFTVPSVDFWCKWFRANEV